jgi:hypothetical protein
MVVVVVVVADLKSHVSSECGDYHDHDQNIDPPTNSLKSQKH